MSILYTALISANTKRRFPQPLFSWRPFYDSFKTKVPRKVRGIIKHGFPPFNRLSNSTAQKNKVCSSLSFELSELCLKAVFIGKQNVAAARQSFKHYYNGLFLKAIAKVADWHEPRISFQFQFSFQQSRRIKKFN